jgi:hypothetical protein
LFKLSSSKQLVSGIVVKEWSPSHCRD